MNFCTCIYQPFSSFRHSLTNFPSLSEEEAAECVLSKSDSAFICSNKDRQKSGGGGVDDVETKMCLCRDREGS